MAKQKAAKKEKREIPEGFEKIPPDVIGIIFKDGWQGRLKVKPIDLMVFTRQFATMIDAGVPLDQTLKTLSEAGGSPYLNLLLLDLNRVVKGGTNLSDAMGKFKRVFTEMYVSMIKVAEVTGDLPGVLLELAEFMEGAIRMKGKIKSAMTYPIMSFGMVLTIAVGLIVIVIPKFETMFVSMGAKLPLPTVIVVGISDFVRANLLATIVIIGGVIFANSRIVKTEKGGYAADVLRMKAPVFGKLIVMIVIARFARTLGTLLRCGVPILKSMEIVQKTVGSKVIERAIQKCMAAVRGGSRVADVFEKEPIFPRMVVKMIDIGERTGQLEALLEKVAKFYDERVSASIDGLTAMIEPLLIAVMGVVVGGIMFAIFLPIIKLTGTVGK